MCEHDNCFSPATVSRIDLLYADEDSGNGNAKWLSALRDAVHHQCANKLEGKAGHQHFPKIGQVRILLCEITT